MRMGGDRTRATINLIGIALKGGNAAVGRDSVRDAVHHGTAACLFLAADAGSAVAEDMRLLSEKHSVPITELSDKEALGRALGRAEVAIVAITDQGLARAAREAMACNDGHSAKNAKSEARRV